MHTFAVKMHGLKWTLRSGAAEGADMAFERGAGPMSEIYLPWHGFNRRFEYNTIPRPTVAAYVMAATVHPGWFNMGYGARALHARNCHQVLGSKLDDPSMFVVCWTPDGCEDEASRNRDTGGTATAIVLAARCGIPVFNLQRAGAMERLLGWLELDT